MKTKEMNLVEYSHSEGVEVKVGAVRFNVILIAFAIIFVIASILLFDYIWGDASVFNGGYDWRDIEKLQLITLKSAVIMLSCLLIYTLLQYGLLYWFSGRDRQALKWNTDWKALGFLIQKPLALKYYRIISLTPFFVMGLLPLIHGFCTGNNVVYFTGVFCIICSSADCYYFWKLRSFDGNDKIVDGKESLSATIIKTSY